MTDIMVIGGGPAGLSAAITARQRNNSVAIISCDMKDSGLYKAPLIGNYPGLPGVTGPELLEKLSCHARDAGASLITGKVLSILPSGGAFSVGYEADVLFSVSVILATGVGSSALFPGEEEFLGRGVSYCATCDGMLYRKKRVCAITLSGGSHEEADYLRSLGCDVVSINTKNIVISGGSHVTQIVADGDVIACDGVFIFRHMIAPHLLLRNLKTQDGFISVSSGGATSVTGVFAAGDCVGPPHQISKAAGQGQVAALSASEYVKNNRHKKEN